MVRARPHASCRLSGPARPEIEEGSGGGAAGAAFRSGARASRLAVAEREEGARGKGAAGATFFAGTHDDGGVGVRTRAFVQTSGH
jgi:hypothetical protein